MKNPVLSTDRVSKTDRGGTLKRLLLHTTPRLKDPGKARRKSPSTITAPKAFPAPFYTPACAQKASPTPPSAAQHPIVRAPTLHKHNYPAIPPILLSFGPY